MFNFIQNILYMIVELLKKSDFDQRYMYQKIDTNHNFETINQQLQSKQLFQYSRQQQNLSQQQLECQRKRQHQGTASPL